MILLRCLKYFSMSLRLLPVSILKLGAAKTQDSRVRFYAHSAIEFGVQRMP